MWPDEYYDWRNAFPFATVFGIVHAHYARYKVLEEDAKLLAFRATEFALDRAEQHRQWPGFFVNYDHFHHWWVEVAVREVRRHLFTVTPASDALHDPQLHPVARQLLYWHYIDQIPFLQMAFSMWGRYRQQEPSWLAEREQIARDMVERAYRDYCQILDSRGYSRGDSTFPR